MRPALLPALAPAFLPFLALAIAPALASCNRPGPCDDCAPPCGDGLCDATLAETCEGCAEDCGACAPECGDGVCDEGENCADCTDCLPCGRCGDGLCDTPENCLSCYGDCGNCGGCGDGICGGNENTDCADCTFEIGEAIPTTIGPMDYVTAELEAAFAIPPAELTAAFLAAEGTTYAFDDWCGAGCSTTWVAAYFAVTEPLLAGALADAADPVDWLMACRSPDGALVANDSYDPAACAALGSCDPGLLLSGAGVWICVFGAAPLPAQNADPYGPIVITASAG